MRLIIATAPGDIAPELARTLVEGRLAACVNIVQKVRSIYYWKGKIEDDEEALMLTGDLNVLDVSWIEYVVFTPAFDVRKPNSSLKTRSIFTLSN